MKQMIKTISMTQDFTHIKTILNTTLKNFRPASDMDMIMIWDIWDNIVGEMIAENAKPEAFRDGVLKVNVSSSVWLQQLRFLKYDIEQKINHAVGRDIVKEIRFKIANLDS